MKRKMNISLLDNVITLLAEEKKLPKEYKDHELLGIYKGFRECHISSDWVLIYYLEDDSLVLTLSRIGSHSDLFR